MKTYKKLEGDKYQITETFERVQNVNLSHLEDKEQRLTTELEKVKNEIKELKKVK